MVSDGVVIVKYTKRHSVRESFPRHFVEERHTTTTRGEESEKKSCTDENNEQNEISINTGAVSNKHLFCIDTAVCLVCGEKKSQLSSCLSLPSCFVARKENRVVVDSDKQRHEHTHTTFQTRQQNTYGAVYKACSFFSFEASLDTC